MKETNETALLNASISDCGLIGTTVEDAGVHFWMLEEEEKKQLSRHLPLAGGSRAASKAPPRSTVSSRPGSTARRRARQAAAPGVPRAGPSSSTREDSGSTNERF